MGNKWLIVVMAVVSLLCVKVAAQDENRPWERLGLSQTEWRLINDNNIKMSKVEELLKDGVSIGEYIQKPWEPLNMTETKWLKKRRSGLTTYDIASESQAKDQSWKKDMNNDAGNDMRQVSKNGEMFSSLFLPGYYQYKHNHKVKGIIMASLAGGALTWCTVGSIAGKNFEVIPITFVLVPDMVWSFIDYKVTKNNERKARQAK